MVPARVDTVTRHDWLPSTGLRTTCHPSCTSSHGVFDTVGRDGSFSARPMFPWGCQVCTLSFTEYPSCLDGVTNTFAREHNPNLGRGRVEEADSEVFQSRSVQFRKQRLQP